MKKLMTVGACAAVAAAVSFGGAAGAAEWPQGFVELEHIQGSDEARFVTDFYPNPQTDKIEAVLSLTDKSLNATIWCARGATTSTKTFSLFYLANKGFRGDYYGSTAGQITEDLPVDPAKLTVTMNRNVLTSPTGQTYQYTSAAGFTKTDGPMTIFASYYNGTDNNKGNYSNYKLYSFRIWRNGELIHNLVPAKDATGAATLCDVSDTPMTITREGTFIAGPAASNLKISAIPNQKWFMRSPVEPHPNVTYVNPETDERTLLTEGTDYELSWSGNTSVGRGMVTVTGKNAYAGEQTATATFDVVNGYGSGNILLVQVNGKVDGDCESWDSAGTLERAFSLATTAGSVIVIEKGTYLLDHTLTNKANTAITIRGETGKAEDVIIDGGNAIRCFYLTGKSTYGQSNVYPPNVADRVVLRDLTVRNGYQCDYADPNGQSTCCGAGANIFYGMVDNCIFENCHAVANMSGLAARGGALFAQIALITNCTFRSCSVSSATSRADGGAIDSVNGGSNYGFTLADSVFSNCVATAESTANSCFASGGAVYNGPGGSVTRIVCTDCVATNTAGWNGYYHAAGGAVCGGSVTDSLFVNCLSYGDGGAFSASGGTVRNCTFVGNRTIASNGGGNGGAVVAKNVYGCFFTNNVANGNGGALSGPSVVSNCVMVGNQSKTGNGGGAVWSASNVRLADCVFERNSQLDLSSGQGGYGGGAVFLGQNNEFGAWFDRCVFRDNVAKHKMDGYYENGGGAIFAARGCTNLVVRNSLFAGNSGNGVVDFRAWTCGGAATLDEGKGARFENCTFVTNVCTAAGNGGEGNSKFGSLFYCRDTSTVTNRLFAVNCVFQDNLDATYGIFNTNYIMPDEGIADRVLHCVSDDAKGFPVSAENGSRVVTKVRNRDLRDKGLDRPWMIGTTDLGDGAYATEKVAHHGIDIVWGGRTARILGSSVDIGSEEKLAPGLMLLVR